MSERRTKLWIDPLQTRMFTRLVSYVVVLSLAIWATTNLWNSFLHVFEELTGSSWSALWFLPVILPFVMLVPIFIYDIIRFTHRFAGPIYRFRVTIQAIAQGEPVAMIRLRKGDYLMEMQDEFNDMLMTLADKGVLIIDPSADSGKADSVMKSKSRPELEKAIRTNNYRH